MIGTYILKAINDNINKTIITTIIITQLPAHRALSPLSASAGSQEASAGAPLHVYLT